MKFNRIIPTLSSYFTVNTIYLHLHDRNNQLDVVQGKNRAERHSLKRWFAENASITKTKIQLHVYLLLGVKLSVNERIRDGIHLSGQKSQYRNIPSTSPPPPPPLGQQPPSGLGPPHSRGF